jgi:hypothetical protein
MRLRFDRFPWRPGSAPPARTGTTPAASKLFISVIEPDKAMTSKKKSPSAPTRFESAAARIHSAAKAIIEADAAAREAKVKRLRKARLERDASEAAQPAAPPAKSRAPKKVASAVTKE